jgi:hypothetical protein
MAFKSKSKEQTVSGVTKVAYQFFIVDKSGNVLSGWEYKPDAVDAMSDQPGAYKIMALNTMKQNMRLWMNLQNFLKTNQLEINKLSAEVESMLKKNDPIATIDDIVAILTDLWKDLKEGNNAKGKCTEYLSQLRYILDDCAIPYRIKSADIVVPKEEFDDYLGSHDYLVLKDGRVLDFTLSQFGLDLPWPYFAKINENFANIKELSLMDDENDKKKALTITAGKK